MAAKRRKICLNNVEIATRTGASSLCIDNLPHELLAKLFRFLDPSSRRNAAQVCHLWRDISRQRCVWLNTQRCLYLSKFRPGDVESVISSGISNIRIYLDTRNKRKIGYIKELFPFMHRIEFKQWLDFDSSVKEAKVQGFSTIIDIASVFDTPLPQLRSLSLMLPCEHHAAFDGSLQSILQSSFNLDSIAICVNQRYAIDMISILNSCKRLRSLQLNHVMDVSLSEFPPEGRSYLLEELSLYSFDLFKTANVPFHTLFPNLRSLKICFADGFSDVVLEKIGHMKALECINFRCAHDLSDAHVARLCHLPRLTKLHISGALTSGAVRSTRNMLSDAAIEHLVNSSTAARLTVLSLSDCDISFQALKLLSEHAGRLQYLRVGKVSFADKWQAVQIVQNMRSLKTIVDVCRWQPAAEVYQALKEVMKKRGGRIDYRLS